MIHSHNTSIWNLSSMKNFTTKSGSNIRKEPNITKGLWTTFTNSSNPEQANCCKALIPQTGKPSETYAIWNAIVVITLATLCWKLFTALTEWQKSLTTMARCWVCTTLANSAKINTSDWLYKWIFINHCCFGNVWRRFKDGRRFWCFCEVCCCF